VSAVTVCQSLEDDPIPASWESQEDGYDLEFFFLLKGKTMGKLEEFKQKYWQIFIGFHS